MQQVAAAAGFRPCQCCKPNEPSLTEHYSTLASQSCRLLGTTESIPNLETLATEIGLSKHHFHRIFKQLTGFTPKAYAVA